MHSFAHILAETLQIVLVNMQNFLALISIHFLENSKRNFCFDLLCFAFGGVRKKKLLELGIDLPCFNLILFYFIYSLFVSHDYLFYFIILVVEDAPIKGQQSFVACFTIFIVLL